MTCERCHENPATVHLTKIEQKRKQELHLCEDCARGEGVVSTKADFSVKGFLEELGDAEAEAPLALSSASETYPPCASCGLTFPTFRTNCRLGCVSCYEHFKPALIPLVEKIHGASQHVGKVPKRLTARLERSELLEALKREQDRAIVLEEYEQAAELRDRIRGLEDDMGSAASEPT
jgi:protein arginine kinase activator